LDGDRKRVLVAIKQKEKVDAAGSLAAARDETHRLTAANLQLMEKIAALRLEQGKPLEGVISGAGMSAAMTQRERVRVALEKAQGDQEKMAFMLGEATALEERYREALAGAIRALQILEG
jgi:hypothetical protein